MRKKLFIFLFVITIFVGTLPIENTFGTSAGATLSGTASTKKGEKFTVTLTYTGATFGSADVTFKYDRNVLQYVSSTDGPQSADGVFIQSIVNEYGTQSLSCSVTFKVIGTGKTEITAETTNLYDLDGNPLGINKIAPKVVSITDSTSTSVSGNANLASLKVSAGSLSPAFSANTTSYTVNVGHDVTVCTVSASTADSGAKWSITGSSSLAVGQNTRKITVTAANGATKTYTLNIYRAAADDGDDKDDDDDKEERPDEIKVTVGDKEYIVVENFGDKDAPQGFAMSVAKLGEYEIPAFVDKNLKYTLVLLKDGETGDEKWFFYDEEKDEFSSNAALTPEEIIAYEEAVENAGKNEEPEEKGIKTETILLIVLGVTGAALLGVVIALQVKLIRNKRQ